jgi:uncharacterized protein (DUF1800 family)
VTRTFISLLIPLLASAQSAVSDHAAGRFLDQATWGPTVTSIYDLETTGMGAWLNNQFALNVSDIPDQAILDAAGKSNSALGPVQAAFFANAVNNPDQLRQRVAFALSEIWVVSTEAVTPAYAYPPYWRVFRDNAFTNYRDIIMGMTLSPAMGRYLNVANNNKGNPAKGTAANENYARELMQLFTIGLNQLNMDGSPVLDSSGNPVPTYTQAIVTSTAKALTGWTYPTAPAYRANYVYGATYGGTLAGSKVDLSQFAQYQANLGSLLDEIDLVFMHKSMSATLRAQALNSATAAASPAHAVAAALYIVLTSGEYSVIQ